MRITDTLDAKLITILGDYFEHDADAQADAVQDIKSTLLAEIQGKLKEREKTLEFTMVDPISKERVTDFRHGYNEALEETNQILESILGEGGK